MLCLNHTPSTVPLVNTGLKTSVARTVLQVHLSRRPAKSPILQDNVRSVTQEHSQRKIITWMLVYFAPPVIKIRKWWPTARPPVTGNASAKQVFTTMTQNLQNRAAHVPSVPKESLSSRNATPQLTLCAVHLFQIPETGCSYCYHL